LRALVRGDNRRKTKTGNPGMEKCRRSVGGGGEGFSFWLAGCTVNDCENVGETLGGRKGAYQIHVNVREFAVGNRNVLWNSVGMAVNFRCLSNRALMCPLSDFGGKAMPNKMGRDEAFGGFDARM
jgi:hypothetical protein